MEHKKKCIVIISQNIIKPIIIRISDIVFFLICNTSLLPAASLTLSPLPTAVSDNTATHKWNNFQNRFSISEQTIKVTNFTS